MNDPGLYRWSLIEIFFAALILAAAVVVPAMLAAAMCGWVPVDGCR